MAAAPDNATTATWFDGQIAAGHPVRVELADRVLRLFAADGTLLRTEAVEAVQLSEPSRNAPRFVYFGDGSTLEVSDATLFNHALDTLGRRPTLVARLQNSTLAATSALALLIAGFIFAYTSGVPLLARWAAFALPDSIEARLGAQFEATLNLEMFKTSNLPEARQAQLRSLLREAAARGAPDIDHKLQFRAMQEGEGINAFSLPGGTIIVLDGLVEAAANDRQVLAVLGHELGHVANKHGLRNVLQALAIGALASAAWGDFAGVAANVPVVFGALHYSRAFELEADSYAVAFLRANNLDAQPLIEFFELIADRREERERSELADFFSTHPQTKERIERLKRM
jgi:predicted Zn-dependent protease